MSVTTIDNVRDTVASVVHSYKRKCYNELSEKVVRDSKRRKIYRLFHITAFVLCNEDQCYGFFLYSAVVFQVVKDKLSAMCIGRFKYLSSI